MSFPWMKRLAAVALAAVGTVVAGQAGASQTAEAWPNRPVTVIVPFGAGGNMDIVARAVAQGMSEEYGQSFIVENRPGAGGMVGAQYTARATPDGYTFMIGGMGNVLQDHLYKHPLLDIRKDLTPVVQLLKVPNYLAVSPDLPVKSAAELIALVKSEPGKHSCANSGMGTAEHLSCEMLNAMAGLDLTIVPYKSGAAAITDVIGGRTTMSMVNDALPYIQDGRLKGLAVTSQERSPSAPELPPLADAIPGYDVASWYALFAPAGTPADIVEKINASARRALGGEALKQRLDTLGATAVDQSVADFQRFFAAEHERWGKLIAPLNIQMD